MIQDSIILQDVQNEWRTVRKTWDMVAANIISSFAGGGYVSHTFRCVAYSLTLLFAFTVLEHVLQQLCKEGHFICNSRFVGPLMSASQNDLVWVDYTLIDEARRKRNDIAHHQQWIEIDDCKRYLDAIENELNNWNILTSHAPIPW